MQDFNGENLYPSLKTRVYRVAREHPETRPVLEGDYGSVIHRVGFKVNREVSLVGLEFFGPARVNVARYRADVAVSRIQYDWGWRSFILYCSDKPMQRNVDLQPFHVEYVQAERGENFVVRFPQPAVVPADLWADIKFKLEGPNTGAKMFGSSEQKVYVDGLGPYTFDFLHGSDQLAAIHFIV